MPPSNAPSPSTFIHASPFALYVFATASSASIIFRLYLSATFLTTSAFIAERLCRSISRLEFAAPALNALKSESSAIKAASRIFKSKRRSGLSEPYKSNASSHESRSKRRGKSKFIVFLKTQPIMPSVTPSTSSRSVKLISISICVNSGCRSPRASSSR